MKKLSLLCVAVLALMASAAHAATAVAQDPETLKAAERYEQVVDVKKMIDDSMAQLKQNPQLHLDDAQLDAMKKSIDYDQLRTFTINTMTEVFSAKELNALADFYGTPEGKSISAKMPVYLSKSMPFIQETIRKVVTTYLQQKAAAQAAQQAKPPAGSAK